MFVNFMPLEPGPQSSKSLEPQECFNKALKTVDALKPVDKARKYTDAELRCLRDACFLTEAELMTSLPIIHKELLSEGHTKRDTDSVLKQ